MIRLHRLLNCAQIRVRSFSRGLGGEIVPAGPETELRAYGVEIAVDDQAPQTTITLWSLFDDDGETASIIEPRTVGRLIFPEAMEVSDPLARAGWLASGDGLTWLVVGASTLLEVRPLAGEHISTDFAPTRPGEDPLWIKRVERRYAIYSQRTHRQLLACTPDSQTVLRQAHELAIAEITGLVSRIDKEIAAAAG